MQTTLRPYRTCRSLCIFLVRLHGPKILSAALNAALRSHCAPSRAMIGIQRRTRWRQVGTYFLVGMTMRYGDCDVPSNSTQIRVLQMGFWAPLMRLVANP